MYSPNYTYNPYQEQDNRVYYNPRRRNVFGFGLPFLLGATLSPFIYGYPYNYYPYYPPRPYPPYPYPYPRPYPYPYPRPY